MSDFVRWLLLALTAGRLVPVASTVMRRSLSCVEQLQVVGIICPAFCEVTLSAASCVCHAVHDIDDKVKQNCQPMSNIVLSACCPTKLFFLLLTDAEYSTPKISY